MTNARQWSFAAPMLIVALLATACGSSATAPENPSPAPARELRDENGQVGSPDEPEALASVDDGTDVPESPTSETDEKPSNDSTEDATAPDSAEDDDEPSSPAIDNRPPIERELDGLIDFVERERGHRFLERPEVTLLETADFTASFAELIERDAEEFATDFANFTEIYQAVGIIDTDQNLQEIWALFGDAGVLGYYDQIDKQIVLRSGEITPFTRIVLVHELVHALDDQIFDLDRPEYDDRDDEISWTFSALVEGNANVIEARYRDTLSSVDQDAARSEERNLPRNVSLSIFTNSFLELQFSRYEFGEILMTDLWERGAPAVDAAITDPPSSSESVIDAEQFLSGTPEDTEIAAPPADGSVFESGTWGQIGWAALFTDVSPELATAADGWGGDSFVAWKSGDQTCVRAHVQADSPDALDRYAEVLEAWARLGNREIFYPTADLIRVTACG